MKYKVGLVPDSSYTHSTMERYVGQVLELFGGNFSNPLLYFAAPCKNNEFSLKSIQRFCNRFGIPVVPFPADKDEAKELVAAARGYFLPPASIEDLLAMTSDPQIAAAIKRKVKSGTPYLGVDDGAELVGVSAKGRQCLEIFPFDVRITELKIGYGQENTKIVAGALQAVVDQFTAERGTLTIDKTGSVRINKDVIYTLAGNTWYVTPQKKIIPIGAAKENGAKAATVDDDIGKQAKPLSLAQLI